MGNCLETASKAVEDFDLPLDDIIDGLKEALETATKAATGLLGQEGGFSNHASRHIGLPTDVLGGRLAVVFDKVRAMPFAGDKINSLERTLNRAAEEACLNCLDVFAAAIKKMNFDDAKAILEGEPRAATNFFQRTCTDDLKRDFRPVIEDKVETVGCLEVFNDIIGTYNSIPFIDDVDYDICEYVEDHAVKQLFVLLGDKEEDIRENPMDQASALLNKVFGTEKKKRSAGKSGGGGHSEPFQHASDMFQKL